MIPLYQYYGAGRKPGRRAAQCRCASTLWTGLEKAQAIIPQPPGASMIKSPLRLPKRYSILTRLLQHFYDFPRQVSYPREQFFEFMFLPSKVAVKYQPKKGRNCPP